MAELAPAFGAETMTHPLRVRSFAELIASNIPQRQPILGQWFTERHLSMLYAPAGVGKSMATLSMAIAIAGGGSFLGWHAPMPRRVLVIDGEMDTADLKERAAMLAQALPDADPELVGENLSFLARMDQKAGVEFPDIANPADHEKIVSHVIEQDATVVVLDNFSTLAGVDDENMASSFNPVIDLMQKLKQYGCAVILVHHSRKGNGKSEGSYRGTSKMAVVFNSIIALSHPNGVLSRSGTAFSWRFEKFRGLRDETVDDFKASLLVELEGAPTWVREEDPDARVVELVRLVETAEFKNREELAAAMGVSTGTISNLKRRALAQGRITEHKWNECLKLAAQGAPEDKPMMYQEETEF